MEYWCAWSGSGREWYGCCLGGAEWEEVNEGRSNFRQDPLSYFLFFIVLLRHWVIFRFLWVCFSGVEFCLALRNFLVFYRVYLALSVSLSLCLANKGRTVTSESISLSLLKPRPNMMHGSPSTQRLIDPSHNSRENNRRHRRRDREKERQGGGKNI